MPKIESRCSTFGFYFFLSPMRIWILNIQISLSLSLSLSLNYWLLDKKWNPDSPLDKKIKNGILTFGKKKKLQKLESSFWKPRFLISLYYCIAIPKVLFNWPITMIYQFTSLEGVACNLAKMFGKAISFLSTNVVNKLMRSTFASPTIPIVIRKQIFSHYLHLISLKCKQYFT